MAGTAGRRAALILCAAIAAQVATAQEARLAVRFAADPEHRGPAGWTFVREHALPALSEELADPFDSLRVTIDEHAKVKVERDDRSDAPPDTSYLRFELIAGGRIVATGTCDHVGRETWFVRGDLDRNVLPPPLRTLGDRFAYEATTGWLTLDLPAATGNLMAGSAEGDLASAMLTIGTAECGTVALFARRGDDGTWRVDGRSDAGLLLPAILVALADLQSGRLDADDARGLADDLDRWLLLAASAAREEQEEAARQLGRFRDPRAIATLERLLRADGPLREIAMHGLVRQGALRSLGAIVAAADPARPNSVALAALAIWTLAPRPVADELIASLPGRPALHVAELRSGTNAAWDAVLIALGAIAIASAIGLVVLHGRYRRVPRVGARAATVPPS